MKNRDKSLQKQASGPIKEMLLKQVLGNRRNADMQSEYSGQFNLSSSLYFQVIEDALRGTLENGVSVLEQSQKGGLEQFSEERKERQPKMMEIYRGLDEIPGKSFTQSQFHFRQNKITKSNK